MARHWPNEGTNSQNLQLKHWHSPREKSRGHFISLIICFFSESELTMDQKIHASLQNKEFFCLADVRTFHLYTPETVHFNLTLVSGRFSLRLYKVCWSSEGTLCRRLEISRVLRKDLVTASIFITLLALLVSNKLNIVGKMKAQSPPYDLSTKIADDRNSFISSLFKVQAQLCFN